MYTYNIGVATLDVKLSKITFPGLPSLKQPGRTGGTQLGSVVAAPFKALLGPALALAGGAAATEPKAELSPAPVAPQSSSVLARSAASSSYSPTRERPAAHSAPVGHAEWLTRDLLCERAA